MKIKANIEILDSTTQEQMDEFGITNKFAQRMFEEQVKLWLKDFTNNGCKCSFNVEITNEVLQ